jgi:Mg2+ and Co2+ transporter CorA
MEERVLITWRRTPLYAAGKTRKLLNGGLKIGSVKILLETLVCQVFEGAYDRKKPIDGKADHIEDKVIAGSLRDARPSLAECRREALRLHRHAMGLKTVFQRMAQESSYVPISSDLLMAASRMLRQSQQLDNEIVSLIDRTRSLQDEVAAMLAEETNKHLRLLSVLSILFMPPTFIAGLFGMNLNGMLFSDSDLGFWKGTTLAVAASIIVWWILKRSGIVGRSDLD